MDKENVMKNAYVFGALLLIFTLTIISCGGEGAKDGAGDSQGNV